MSETENTTDDAVLDAEQEEDESRVRTWELQRSIKWVNFQMEVQARTEEEAIQLAWKSYDENGLKDFTVKAGDDEYADMTSLEDIFRAIPKCFDFEANCID
jgi:hypothetical protein